MTDQQPYRVLQDYADFELRHYPDHVLVQVDVTGDFAAAGNAGFGPLFRYLSGDNNTATRIAMTAPVLQASTAPARHTVSFVLPERMQASDVPVPSNVRVSTRAVSAHTVAARRFSGGWTEARFRANGEALLAAVRRERLEPLGGVYSARFDPPWKPGFLKRNEALVAVA